MKKPEAFECDVCGAPKGETNHWRVLVITELLVTRSSAPDSPIKIRELRISEWLEEAARIEGARHACGNNCTQKLVERYLATGKLEAPRKPAGDAA